jgi:hypothetical protein
MDDWHSLAYHGDEWLVGYACLPHFATSVVIFSVGHALELYLKAAYTKLSVNLNEAIKFGHDVKRLWDACKERDPTFLQGHELRDSICSADPLVSQRWEKLSRDDLEHWANHQVLYVVAKHLQDLKYWGLPWTTLENNGAMKSICYLHPDPYWIALFRDLRGFLGYPEHGKGDFIKQHMKDIPPAAASYLSGLYR